MLNIPTVLRVINPEELQKTEIKEKPDKARDKTAIIICHGMGQQVKFQTLSTLSDLLLKKSGSTEIKPDKVGLVKYENDVLPRVTLELKNGKEEKEVHLYETYWAPLTEGRVTLSNVISFLLNAGSRGVKFSFKKKFNLWMFGGMRDLDFHRLKTFIILFSILLMLLIVGAVYFLTTTLVVSKIIIELTYLLDNIERERLFGGLVSYFKNVYTTLENNPEFLLYLTIYALLIWLLRRFKKLLIEYPGDVAAYVTSYKLNKFYEIRDRIKEKAMLIAKAVYYSVDNENKSFLYDNIIVVGHSLGSVIAYDMLNSIINDDLMLNRSYEAVKRTKLFLTFGSPLNKTAFLFRTQLKEDSKTREILAASAQPLICSYNYRPDKWVNIWSRWDIISSKLTYYDLPQTDNPKKVENIIDLSAMIPLAAHNQYWKNETIINVIYNSIFHDSK